MLKALLNVRQANVKRSAKGTGKLRQAITKVVAKGELRQVSVKGAIR